MVQHSFRELFPGLIPETLAKSSRNLLDRRDTGRATGTGEALFFGHLPLGTHPTGDWFWCPDGLPPGRTVSLLSSRLGRNGFENPRVAAALRTFFGVLAAEQVVLTCCKVTLDHALLRGAWLFDRPIIRLLPLPARLNRETAERIRRERVVGQVFRVFYSSADDVDRDSILLGACEQARILSVRPAGKLLSAIRERCMDRSPNGHVTLLALVDDQLIPAKLRRELNEIGCHDWWIGSHPGGAYASDDKSGVCAPVVPFDTIGGPFISHWTRSVQRHWPDANDLSQWDWAYLGPVSDRYRDCMASLCRILVQRRLRGSGKLIAGSVPVCCFTAVPLDCFWQRRKYRSHLGRWDFEPFGISIRKSALQRCGGRPVHYIDMNGAPPGASTEAWNTVADPKNRWREEQEWRVPGDLDLRQFSADEAIVFTRDQQTARIASQFSRWPVTIVPGPGGSESDSGIARQTPAPAWSGEI